MALLPRKRKSLTPNELGHLFNHRDIISAFYNVLVFFIAASWLLGAAAFYFLFRDFAKPMIWAVICGIMVYPLKRSLTGKVCLWLDQLIVSDTALTFGLLALPWNMCIHLGSACLKSLNQNLRVTIMIVVTFPTMSLLLHLETLPRILVSVIKLFQTLDHMIWLCNSCWIPILFISYVGFFVLNKFLVSETRRITPVRCTATAAWCFLLAHLCSYMGPLRAPTFLAVLLISLGSHLFLRQQSSCSPPPPVSTQQRDDDDILQDSVDSTNNKMAVDHEEDDDDDDEADKYIQWLFIACAFVWTSLHLSLTILLLIPLCCTILNNLAFHINDLLKGILNMIWTQLSDLRFILMPSFLTKFTIVLKRLDKWFTLWLRGSMDFVGSVTAILLLILCAFGLSTFIALQLYYESVNLVNIATEIGNRTITYNPSLKQWLKEVTDTDSVKEIMENAVKKSYTMARLWLSTQVHQILEGDEQKAKKLEEQLLSTVDTYFYNFLSNESITSQNITVNRDHYNSWKMLWSVVTMENWDDQNILENVKEELTVLWMIAESSWQFFKNNLEIVAFSFGRILSTLLASGTAVIDFFLDSTVFLTFLLYLLNKSDKEFKPLRMLRELMPIDVETSAEIAEEVEQATHFWIPYSKCNCRSVFLVTVKMAFFYGMFTWLTHTLFAVSLVFIPSVCAAILAAVPFFGTYLVSFPAVLELWLIKGEPFLAAFLFFIHYGCSYVVDDSIYAGIKLTTPFLTGMAVAGGLMWWGLEGAIFGPLVLCFLLVLVSTYKILVVNSRNLIHKNGIAEQLLLPQRSVS
ncbi:Transmembrane protein [Trichinella pseudospiralis]|uniref:Transmembrane protein n=1 Tax=Trichinella pseudospiralis TaxID=6337 RepID=A0A0V1I486_TRIPS|nr:Transmembrane protein [Trichinella pseudospiralis]